MSHSAYLPTGDFVHSWQGTFSGREKRSCCILFGMVVCDVCSQEIICCERRSLSRVTCAVMATTKESVECGPHTLRFVSVRRYCIFSVRPVFFVILAVHSERTKIGQMEDQFAYISVHGGGPCTAWCNTLCQTMESGAAADGYQVQREEPVNQFSHG